MWYGTGRGGDGMRDGRWGAHLVLDTQSALGLIEANLLGRRPRGRALTEADRHLWDPRAIREDGGQGIHTSLRAAHLLRRGTYRCRGGRGFCRQSEQASREG